MKNMLKLFLATAIVMIFALPVQSQNAKTQAQPAIQEQTTANLVPGTFIDKNNDGICDNFELRQGKGRGSNFVDKNSDGICDNRTNAGRKNATAYSNTQGNQHRYGQGKGKEQGQWRGQGNCGRR